MQFENLGRISPQNIEAEEAVLGSCLLDKDIFPEVIKIISSRDFYRENHYEIFEAINELFIKQKPIDVITVADVLKSRGKLDQVGGLEYLTNIAVAVPTTANAGYYTSIVKSMSVRRQLIKGSSDIIDMAYEQSFDNVFDLKNAAMQRLDIQIKDHNKRRNDIAGIVMDCLNDLDKQYNSKTEDKFFTGFSDYDKVTAGFHPQELTIIAARPGVGKTAFAIQLILNLSRKKITACLYPGR